MNLSVTFSGTVPLAASFLCTVFSLLTCFYERLAGAAPIFSLPGLFDNVHGAALMSGPAPRGADAATAVQAGAKLRRTFPNCTEISLSMGGKEPKRYFTRHFCYIGFNIALM